MVRKIVVVVSLVMLWPILVFAERQLEDVVYLKNGSIIQGVIIELSPGASLKLRTRDGSIFVYQMDEILKIAKEAPIAQLTEVKSPGKALGLSLVGGLYFATGVGQWYNGDIAKGFVFFGLSNLANTSIVKALEDNINSSGAMLRLSSYAIAAIDAYESAKRKNESQWYRDALKQDSPRVALSIIPVVRNHPSGVFILATTSF